MAITFVGDSVTVDSNGGTVTGSTPSGTPVNGDVFVAACTVYDNTSATTTVPAEWTQYIQFLYSGVGSPGRNWLVTIASHVRDGTDSLAFTCSADYTVLYIGCWRGVDTTTPLVDTATTNSGSGTTATGLGITVSNSGSWLLAFHNGYDTGLSVGFGGMTAREVNYDSVNNVYDEAVGTGATGNRTATVASSDRWSVTMGVLKAAAAATVSDPGFSASRKNIRTNAIYRMDGESPPPGYRRRGRIYVPAHVAA